MIFSVHGFLGLGSDWDSVFSPDIPRYSYDFFRPSWSENETPLGLNELASQLNDEAKKFQLSRVLVGYSWGGRLALHALLQAPEIWSAAIIISSHPGLTNQLEREKRVEADRVWANRFRTEEWGSLLEAWNSQSVLKNTGTSLQRREFDFSRQALAHVLEFCSLGKQEDLRPQLKTLSVPILWISGDSDAKFREFPAQMAQLNPLFQKRVIPHAGHRVPWDQPEKFREAVQFFLENNVALIERN
jgi:2-succinyl-6-hydroxy-2,4-cyclohexadiene-1-carboxylate synthase